MASVNMKQHATRPFPGCVHARSMICSLFLTYFWPKKSSKHKSNTVTFTRDLVRHSRISHVLGHVIMAFTFDLTYLNRDECAECGQSDTLASVVIINIE